VSWFKTLQKLTEIPEGTYEGYLWLSDEEAPRLVNTLEPERYERNGLPANPFIREGFLFDEKAGVSVAIRHVPGKYHIHSVFLEQLPQEREEHALTFLAHKALPGPLKFREIWLPEPDDLCDGLNVLRKKAVIFTGFDKEVQ